MRTEATWRDRRGCLLALVILASLGLNARGIETARADAASCDQACWREAMAAYAANPNKERGGLLALERLGTEALPPEILLLLADAHLRSGHNRAAKKLFERVSGSDAPEVLHSWALLGGAWMAARSGDVDRAVTLLGDAGTGEYFEPAAVLLWGYLEASRGISAGAGRLQELLADPRATPEIRSATRMVLGLTYYWSGHPDRARQEFQTVASDDGSVLKDEATYGVARMMLAEGRTAEAKALLERLVARRSNLPTGTLPAGLLDLERRALLRTGFKGYRRTALGPPAAQVVRLLDWNGAAFAKALLARLERDDREDSEIQLATLPEPAAASDEVVGPRVSLRAGDGAPEADLVEPSGARLRSVSPGADARGSDEFGFTLFGLAAIVIVASVLALLGRGMRWSIKR